MPETVITLIKGDRIGTETDYRDALMVNMYAVDEPRLGVAGYLLTYPGLTKYSDVLGADRAGVYNERFTEHYRVSGNKFISVDENGIASEIGTFSGSKQVSMPYSFNTQAIVGDGKYYLYDSVNGYRQVTDPEVGSPIDATWIDSYYFFTDGEFLYHTDINNESSIDPLKFATAEFSPDPTLGVGKTQDNKVIAFGRYSIEYFQNVATDNFAFTRIPTRAQKIGIVATHAKVESDGVWYIAGGRKSDSVGVFIVNIGSSDKISTREIDKIFQKYTEPELSNIRMEARTDDNINFIIIHLPDETLCFNVNVAKKFGRELAWSILKSDVAGNDQYRAINGVFDARNVKWIYGDKNENVLAYLDDNSAVQYNKKIETIFYTPFLRLEQQSIDKIEIDTIPGQSSVDDANVFMSLTYDGVTYGKEWINKYGEPNNYQTRFIFRRLGYVRDWVGFKFRAVSNSRMAFSATVIEHG